jgi:hypothetical protein
MDLGEGPNAMATSTLTVIFMSCAGDHLDPFCIITKAENSKSTTLIAEGVHSFVWRSLLHYIS